MKHFYMQPGLADANFESIDALELIRHAADIGLEDSDSKLFLFYDQLYK